MMPSLILIGMGNPLPPQGNHQRAVREPGAGRTPRIPGAYDGPSRNPGSQSREPMPSDWPRLKATPWGESAGGRPPARLRQTGPDTRFVPGGQGVAGSNPAVP